MWCGRFSSPQLVHSFGFAAESESWERRLLRRDLDTLFCWTAMSGAFVFGAMMLRIGCNGPCFGSTPVRVCGAFRQVLLACPTLFHAGAAKYTGKATFQVKL